MNQSAGKGEVEVSLFFPDRETAETFAQGLVFYHAVKEEDNCIGKIAVIEQVMLALMGAQFVQVQPLPRRPIETHAN